MNEKRISLRFRVDNELDMKVWNLLDETARMKNVSKNSLIMELLMRAFEQENSDDAFAERIAELVARKLSVAPMMYEAKQTLVIVDAGKTAETTEASNADEPELLGEEALDFLGAFG